MQPVAPIKTSTSDSQQKIDDLPKTPDNKSRETSPETQPRAPPNQDTDSDVHLVRKDAQVGVQKIEATTQVWSNKHLLAAYVM
jgi:hypothetical protein